MTQVCPDCGAEQAAEARFCNSCGAALDPGATRTSPAPYPSPGASGTSSSGSIDHGRFSPGTLIGDRYRIVARLGAGGMGEVYRADDLKIGHAVALKFLPEAVERDAERRDRLMAEIRAARQISHANVCRLYDVGEVDGRPFLSMEYVDGEDLRSLLRRIGRLPEDKAIEIARQICAGLAAIHDRGVLHRDLKPANIMLDGRGKVRLTDFGLATTVTSRSDAGHATTGGGHTEIAGTPAYMAPEQFAGQPLTPATDLYALGLVLYELFTGQRLQAGDDIHAIRSAQFTQAQTLTTGESKDRLDPIVRRVIERCLDLDPKRRPQSAVVIAAALPGGDPLAEALAAGETPSPQMVAAAGEDRGLSFKVAVPLLAMVVVGVIAGVNAAIRHAAQLPPFPYSPEVLESRARDMVGRLGYTVFDSASGFRTYEVNSYRRWLAQQDPDRAAAPDFKALRPSVLRFWYRTHSDVLYTDSVTTLDNSARPGIDTPPLMSPGMTYLELDAQGRLEKFHAVAPSWTAPDSRSPPPDWPAFFREAGLDFDTFTETAPEWLQPLGADIRMAWTGPAADAAGSPLRVEAAAFKGQLVSFRLFTPWDRPGSVEAGNAAPIARRDFDFLVFFLIVGVPALGAALAVRNIRRGRSDLRGATRLVVALGVVTMAAGLVGSTSVHPLQLIVALRPMAAWGALIAVVTWLLYAAVEPHLRRHWPTMLISWARLLEGRWRDPMVGRDLLVGMAVAALYVTVRSATIASAGSVLGSSQRFVMPDEWTSPLLAISQFLGLQGTNLAFPLGLMVVLVLGRIVLRSELRAAVVLFLAFGSMDVAASFTTGAGNALTTVVSLAGTALIVFLATRFGLVALLGIGLSWAQSSDLVLPYGVTSAVLTRAALILLPAALAFYTSTRGRMRTDWLDE